ncbi:MAG: hypothetical protein J6Q06_05540, partial [Clostridia bacterium]|nr:hypothetical protein [Clostridia bacterium]
ILALFTNNLLDGYLGDWFSALITAFYIIFFFVICTSAFQVVDIEGYIKMFAPATSLSIRKRAVGSKRHRPCQHHALKRLRRG